MAQIRRIPKLINEEHLKQVLQTISSGSNYQKNKLGEFLRWRDSTAICLMSMCGLRPAECLMLKWEDVDFNSRLIKINAYHNKERNNMPAILTKPAILILENYKKAIDNFNIKCDFLFPSVWTWQPITVDAFGKRFQSLCKEAGLLNLEYYTESGRPVYNFNLYSMRHAFCTKIYKATKSEEAVTQLARHLRPESAHVYIHLNTDDKKEIADKVFD